MQPRFILCAACGAKNRLVTAPGKAVCGTCGQPLKVPHLFGLNLYARIGLAALTGLAAAGAALFILY